MKKTALRLFSLLCFTLGSFRSPEPSRPGGKDYALFIAVEQYDNSSSWKTLPGLIQECKDIRSDLVSRYGFSEESKVLENPTLSEVMAELARWRARTYGPDDQLLVFFSGHGKFLDDLQEGFFIPRDGKPVSGDITDRKWYSLLQLPRHINTIPCRHILLAIDACYSGTIDSHVALKDETEDWATPSNTGDAQFNQYVHDLLANKSRILMTSGGKTRTKHPSDFARYFREALATLGGKDRLLRTTDIEDLWLLGAGRPLAGNFEGHEAGGNFLFVYQPKANNVALPAGSIDYDDDGVPDTSDKCPTEKGPSATKGCPDADGDGVADKFDGCKTQAGPASNNGCPEARSPESMEKYVVTYADNISIWKLDGTLVRSFNQSASNYITINSLAVSQDGKIIGSCGATNTSFWTASNGELICELSVPNLKCIDFYSDSKSFAGDNSGKVYEIGINKGVVKPIRSFVAFKNDTIESGEIINIQVIKDKIAVINDENLLRIYDNQSQKLLFEYKDPSTLNDTGLNGFIKSIDFSPDGKYLAVGGGHYANVLVFDMSTYRVVTELSNKKSSRAIAWGLCFSPDGTKIAVSSSADQITIWDWKKGVILTQTGKGLSKEVVDCSPDGDYYLIEGEGGFEILLPDGKLFSKIPVASNAAKFLYTDTPIPTLLPSVKKD